jgi:3-phenylpropionate/trans-cinnamate dioxygenase ferredoxin subunit
MEFVRVAAVGDIKPGKAIRVEIGDEPVAIFNVDGTLYAIGDTCTHEEASLSEGDVYGDCVECPLHGAEFDLKTGTPRTLPAVVPVATYPVKVEGEDVLVGVEG